MSMSNVKVSTRLSLGFGAILLIMLALTAIGIWRMQVISDVMVTMTQQDNLRLQETVRWRENREKNWIRTRAMLLNASPQFNAILEPEIAATSAAISESQMIRIVTMESSDRIRVHEGFWKRLEGFCAKVISVAPCSAANPMVRYRVYCVILA